MTTSLEPVNDTAVRPEEITPAPDPVIIESVGIPEPIPEIVAPVGENPFAVELTPIPSPNVSST